jgi:D-alanyl-D-alanine carboxypeptidase
MPLFTLAACVDPATATDDQTSAVTAACADDGAAGSPADSRFPDAAKRDLQQTLDAVVAAGVAFGVNVAIHHPVHREFSAAAGVADLDSGAPLTPAHRFRAGSMLKTAVAVATLQLVEHRKLSLDARLTDLLPRGTTARVAEAENITVRMLLAHTGGVPEFTGSEFTQAVVDDPTRVWTVAEFLDLSAAHPRPFAPGAGWAYSNTDYVLLGEVLEATTGEPWRETVERRVLARAGLTHSSLPRPGNPACKGCSRGYELFAGELLDITEVDPSMAGAAGGDALITTTGDLVRFLRALHAARLFDRPATLAVMESFGPAPLPAEAQTGYGLGLARFDVNGVELIGHLGATAGFQGFMLLNPGTGVVVSGYMNRRPGGLGNFILPVLASVARIP